MKTLKQPVRKRCPICKYRIRGANHEQGEHHQMAMAKAGK